MYWLILLVLFGFVLISGIMAYLYPGPGTRIFCAVFILFLGISLIAGNIEYKSGEVKTYYLNDSFNITQGNITTTDQYITYNSYFMDFVGLLFLLLAVAIILYDDSVPEYVEEEGY